MPENPLSTAMKIDPKLVEHMKSEDDWASADGALPRKTKLLIAIAYNAAHGGRAVCGLWPSRQSTLEPPKKRSAKRFGSHTF